MYAYIVPPQYYISHPFSDHDLIITLRGAITRSERWGKDLVMSKVQLALIWGTYTVISHLFYI